MTVNRRILVFFLSLVAAFGVGAVSAHGHTVEIGTFAFQTDDPDVDDNIVSGDQTTDDTAAFSESNDSIDKDVSSKLDDLNPFETWELLFGFLVSGFVVPALRQWSWSTATVKLVALGCAAITAIIGSYLRGELTNIEYSLAAILKLGFVVYASYETVWKARFFHGVVDRLERSFQTTPPPA